jgi:hypothetical protein
MFSIRRALLTRLIEHGSLSFAHNPHAVQNAELCG